MHYAFNKQQLIIKNMDDNDSVISGYASVYNVADHQNDIIQKGAFHHTERNQIKLLWQHDTAKPIGVIKSLKEDERGLLIEATINSKTQLGQESIALIKQGAVNGLSIGFYIKSFFYNDSGQRVITDADLLEVSVVTFPANQYAQINSVYSASQDVTRLSAALDQLNQFLQS